MNNSCSSLVAFGIDGAVRWRPAQDGPIHVGAQVLAADGALGGAFDLGAAFSWDATNTIRPLGYQNRHHTNFTGEVFSPHSPRIEECLELHDE